MQELIYSIVRLSAAATLYSMQQVQNSVSDFDTKESLQSIRQLMDGVTNALVAKLDDGKKEILDNIAETSGDVAGAIERDMKDIRETADDVLHRTLKATRAISHIGSQRKRRGDVTPMASVAETTGAEAAEAAVTA